MPGPGGYALISGASDRPTDSARGGACHRCGRRSRLRELWLASGVETRPPPFIAGSTNPRPDRRLRVRLHSPARARPPISAAFRIASLKVDADSAAEQMRASPLRPSRWAPSTTTVGISADARVETASILVQPPETLRRSNTASGGGRRDAHSFIRPCPPLEGCAFARGFSISTTTTRRGIDFCCTVAPL